MRNELIPLFYQGRPEFVCVKCEQSLSILSPWTLHHSKHGAVSHWRIVIFFFSK